jgi:parvulin-like peptidyl-prolyl isomerase
VDAVDELLILQRGVELGYKLSDEQFNQIVQQIRKENKLDSDEQFTAALKGEGMTVADLRRNIERSMIINRVQQQDVMEKIAITETETKAYYEAHKNEFTAPASVTLREILVAVPEKAPDGSANAGQAGVNVGLDEDAKAKVEAIRARVLKGENFANVAAKESDAASKANGGLIGPILPDELAPALVKALEAMKVGEVSQPMRAQRGWQIIKLEARADSVTPPLEQIRNQVTDRVYREKSRPELTRYLRRLREQAIIEWKNDELKKIYEEQVKTLEASPAAAEPESKTPDLKTPDPKTPGPKTR